MQKKPKQKESGKSDRHTDVVKRKCFKVNHFFVYFVTFCIN